MPSAFLSRTTVRGVRDVALGMHPRATRPAATVRDELGVASGAGALERGSERWPERRVQAML